MAFLEKIADIATGGLAKEVFGMVKAYFPPDMPPEKQAEVQLGLEQIAMQREKNVNDGVRDAEQAINERIKVYEGTASDLAAIPILGAVMLFLRGAQRPIIGYATIWLDYQVFSGVWKLEAGPQESSFWIINFLVLGFLFGERALKNVAPLISEIMAARKA